jgi:hypothetical protein
MMHKQETEQNDAILFCFFCGMKMNGMVFITFFLQMIKVRVSSFPQGETGRETYRYKRGFSHCSLYMIFGRFFWHFF